MGRAGPAEAKFDLRSRILDDVDHAGSFEVVAFCTAAVGGAGSLPGRFGALEPLFGPRVLRHPDLAATSRLMRAPREVPRPRATEPDQTACNTAAVIDLMLLAAAVGRATLVAPKLPGSRLTGASSR